MRENRMEYEANIFVSQASLPGDTILEYIENGYDIQQIARAMSSDINLVALKVDTLIAQGYQLRKQEHRSDFCGMNIIRKCQSMGSAQTMQIMRV